MSRIGWARVAVVTGLLLTASLGSASAADGTMRLHGIGKGHVLWLRAEPNARASKVGFIPAWGRNIRALGCRTTIGWCQVRYRGTTGWAPSHNLKSGAPRFATG